MQATNGSSVPFRSRNRLIGCCMAVVLALSALAFASTASAGAAPVSKTYLALGDSLAFGYSHQLFVQNFPTENPTAFENGYTNAYFKNKYKEGLQLTNKGCPGETTDSMIGNSALAAAFGIPGESPCAYHKAGFPLHSEYGGKSQLESAIETIAVDAATATPVTIVSLDIGPNDELHQVSACEKEVAAEFKAEGKSKYGATPEAAVQGCIRAHVPALFTHILANIGRSLFAIRNGALFGGVNYGGKIIVLGVYNAYGAVFTPGVELLPGSNEIATALNAEEAKLVEKPEYGACYANSLPKFNPQNKQEPERLQAYTEMANKVYGQDIHPTPEGYTILGKIMSTVCGG